MLVELYLIIKVKKFFAAGIVDSTGAYTQMPTFKEGDNLIEPDSLIFNFKTQKALVFNSRTEQGGFKVKGEISKRQNDSIYYLANAKFQLQKMLMMRIITSSREK